MRSYLSLSTLEKLVSAIDAYEQRARHYDEVFLEVHNRISNQGSIGKSDIGALVLWKRIQANSRWAEHLLMRPEAEVRAVTAEVFSSGKTDEERLDLLATLDGFRTGRAALASAVLSAWDSLEFGVIDRWSRRAITLFQMWGNELYPQPLAGAIMNYTTYLTMIRHMRDQLRETGRLSTARDIDKGLFWIGREEPHAEDEEHFG